MSNTNSLSSLNSLLHLHFLFRSWPLWLPKWKILRSSWLLQLSHSQHPISRVPSIQLLNGSHMYLLLSHSQLLSPPVSHLLYNSLPARMPASFLPTAGHPPAKNSLIACFLYLLRQNSDFAPAALDSLSFPRHVHASLSALFQCRGNLCLKYPHLLP